MNARARMRFQGVTAAITFCLSTGVASAASLGFSQVNLSSSVPGLAANTDSDLRNPWGISSGPATPFWVSDQVTGVSTLYNSAGVKQALVVTIPGGNPTGQVFVGGAGFNMKGGGQATFVFATLTGTIAAWTGASGTLAEAEVISPPGNVYTGLAVVGTRLYAANTSQNKIDIFDQNFNATTVAGSFVDPNVPAGFTPYNIQNVGGKLYVEYAKQNSPGGFVGVFDANGNLLQHISDPHLNGPWGIALAPGGFGDFANALLIGNFGDGMINAFDPGTGGFLGTLSDPFGNPLVNSGLWGLGFRAPGSGFDPNTLFFVAGINDERDGLFGAIRPVPEPATLSLLGIALSGLAARRRLFRPRS